MVLLSALAVGLILSCAQILFDAYKTRSVIATEAQRILRMSRDPSTQALYSLDREMGAQVMEGRSSMNRYASPPSATPTKRRWRKRPARCCSSRPAG